MEYSGYLEDIEVFSGELTTAPEPTTSTNTEPTTNPDDGNGDDGGNTP